MGIGARWLVKYSNFRWVNMSNSEKKITEVRLNTVGCEIVFYFSPTPFPNQARLQIVIESQSVENKQRITSMEAIVERDEFMSMCEYLLNHSEKIKENPQTISQFYQDYTVLYMVQGLEGLIQEILSNSMTV